VNVGNYIALFRKKKRHFRERKAFAPPAAAAAAIWQLFSHTLGSNFIPVSQRGALTFRGRNAVVQKNGT